MFIFGLGGSIVFKDFRANKDTLLVNDVTELTIHQFEDDVRVFAIKDRFHQDAQNHQH